MDLLDGLNIFNKMHRGNIFLKQPELKFGLRDPKKYEKISELISVGRPGHKRQFSVRDFYMEFRSEFRAEKLFS